MLIAPLIRNVTKITPGRNSVSIRANICSDKRPRSNRAKSFQNRIVCRQGQARQQMAEVTVDSDVITPLVAGSMLSAVNQLRTETSYTKFYQVDPAEI
jgi:hypothetical protein